MKLSKWEAHSATLPNFNLKMGPDATSVVRIPKCPTAIVGLGPINRPLSPLFCRTAAGDGPNPRASGTEVEQQDRQQDQSRGT
jgi:hypothetical protein